MSYDEYAGKADRNDDKKRYENKILYGQASKKTQEFLKSTKEMRLSIEKQLETLDDNDSSSMMALTRCLEDRIKQCDVTLNNLLQLKDRFLNKQILSAPTLAAMKVNLPFPTDGLGSEVEYGRNCSNLFSSDRQHTNDSFASTLNEYSFMRPTPRQRTTNDILNELTEYDPLGSIRPRSNSHSASNDYDCSMDLQADDEVMPHVTGFTRYPENEAQPCTQYQEIQQDIEEPHVTGFVKFYSNIGDMQKILEQNCRERDGQMARIEAFVKGQNSEGHPFSAGGNPPELVHKNVAYDWGHPTPVSKPMHMNPICCGPSKLRPIFDTKIQKLEQQIVKYCFEIKEKNILIEQCCRAKEVLMCQKHNLHNILLKLCEKIKQLERKLYRIKMAVCCPNFPIQDCSANSSCREEIKSLKKLEDKLETLFNGAKHKECLLEICKKSVSVLQQDKVEWQTSIKDMERIRGELQKQLEDMKLKVCRRKLPSPSPRLFTAEEPTIGIGAGTGTGTGSGTGTATGRSSGTRSPRKSQGLEDSDSSALDDYISKDYDRRPKRSARSRSTTSPQMPVPVHSCRPDCRCKKR